MLEVLLDSVLDSLKIFPFIFVIYVFMEIMENAKNKERIERAMRKPYAPFFSALTGIVPECGFSVMCAKLYDSGMIKIGTLIAAFIASSDEGLIILMSNGTDAVTILITVFYKLIFAIFFGLLFNALLGNIGNKHVCPDKDDCFECGERHEEPFDKFLKHPFYHSAKTFIYFLAVNFILGTAIYLIGEGNINAFLNTSKYIQPLFAIIIGLIPNCASSMFIAQAFTEGVICLPALISGLAVNSGMGLIILLNNKKNIKNNIVLILLLIVSALVTGYIAFI